MHFVQAKQILSPKNGMNIYRGCTHGCIYCDSRSRCYGFKHAFEDIEVKENAPHLLEQRLKSKRERCMIGTGAMCDPYMHCEESLGLMRQCLEIIERYGFGVAIQTKSNRILRDLDLLKAINKKAKCVVQVTLTTVDETLCKIIEPHVSTTKERVKILQVMKDNDIPTVVWMTPILPFINDNLENIRGLMDWCIEQQVQGIMNFGMGLTLREGDREYYYDALDRYFPGLSERYRKTYGLAYEISSPREKELMAYFTKVCSEKGILYKSQDVFAYLNAFPEINKQLSLFTS